MGRPNLAKIEKIYCGNTEKLMIEKKRLELRFENALRRICPDTSICADTFSVSPGKALEDGLLCLHGHGLISQADFCEFIETYDFGEESLGVYLQRENGFEMVEELVRRMENIAGIGKEELLK